MLFSALSIPRACIPSGLLLPCCFTFVFAQPAVTLGALSPGFQEVPKGLADYLPATSIFALVISLLLVVVLLFMMTRNARERRLMNERLIRAERMESLGRLASGVAHDFNNMLTGILGASELALDNPCLTPELSVRLELIRDTTIHASDLTRTLLTFSRRVPTRLRPLDVHAMIDMLVTLVSRSMDRRISVHTDYGAETSTVLGDATQLQNALLNLAVNARDAMPKGGTLTLATRNRVFDGAPMENSEVLKEGRYIEITVSDTGTGVAPELLSRIFEPFFTTKPSGKGSGLGLSSVYGTFHSHRGDIGVTSTLGRGTVFTMHLPIAHVTPEILQEQNKNHTDNETSSNEVRERPAARVLVVDDEPAVRDIIVQTLTMLGYTPFGVASAVKALEHLKDSSNNIDVAIVDLVLPEMDGPECARRIWKIIPKLPIIFASGYSREHVEHLKDNGHELFFLQKPFDRQQLDRIVMQALSSGQAHDSEHGMPGS